MSELNESAMIRIASRASESEQILKDVKVQLEELATLLQAKRYETLSARLYSENETLRREVEEHKTKLLQLEKEHHVPQVSKPPFPRQPGSLAVLTTPPTTSATSKELEPHKAEKVAKPKGSKNDKAKPSKDSMSNTKVDMAVDISRLDLRIGRILSAKKHHDADSLYVEEVDVGEAEPRCVVSGLVKHVPLEDMQNRLAVLLCNLKPVAMRGVKSQAMVMCASTPEKVEILIPPAGSQPGDLVLVDGYPRNPDNVLNPKHKVFETVAPDLKTDSNCVATYKGIPWTVAGKGSVTAPTLTGAPIK